MTFKKGKKFKKGDRVTATQDNKTIYGTVVKGGSKKIEVILDGGESVVEGLSYLFDYSEKPLPTDDVKTVMDNYTIKNWQEIEGHGDSRTFTADIYYKGKKVIRVSNDGWGGGNHYDEYEKGSYKKIIEDSIKWVKELGFKFKEKDMSDIWVEWYKYRKPYGVTAKDEIKDYEEIFKI